MADGGAFIHNGIISISGIPEEQSDTRHFVTTIIDALPRRWQHTPEWCEMVEKMIGMGSKAVALWPDGSLAIFGEDRGFWEDENEKRLLKSESAEEVGRIWYSNDSCRLPSQWEKDRRAGKHPVSVYEGWRNPNGSNSDPKVLVLPKHSKSTWNEGAGSNESRLVQTGPNTFRCKTDEEIAAEKAARKSALTAIETQAQIAALDDDEFEQECIDQLHMCPRCATQFGDRAPAYYHFKNCTKTLSDLLRRRRA